MNGICDNIKYLSRPRYDDFPPMSAADRAAQFSPFAALVGYGEAIAETARLTDSRSELTEDEANLLNAGLGRLLDITDERPEVRVTYFVPDKHKAGGRYIDKKGNVRIYDSYTGELVFTDGAKVAINDLLKLIIL